MYNEKIALYASFIAMLLIVSSYFYRKKSLYLLFQAVGMTFLMASYLFDKEYFAMIGLGVGLFRALTFYVYEKRDKLAPVFWSFLCALLTVACYFLVNIGVQKTAKPLDILYLCSLILYAFVFRIRDMKKMRLAVLAPTGLAVLYNALIKSSPFVVISYAFEAAANLVAILKYDIFTKEKGYEKR